MAKKKRKPAKRAGEAEILSRSILDAFLGARQQPALNVTEMATSLREDANFAGVWSVEASKACCHQPYRDGVIIGIPSWEMIADKRAHDACDPTYLPIRLSVIDTHRDQMAMGMLDVEDAKQLVNALTQAIATIEAMATAAT